MNLFVPFIGQPHATDARLTRLAEFLGVTCVPLALDLLQGPECVRKAIPDKNSCLVLNPLLIRRWLGDAVPWSDLCSDLLSSCSYVLVHALTLDPCVDDIIARLSDGKIHAVRPVPAGASYEVASDTRDFCGPFSGMSFGPIDATNDCVVVPRDDTALQKLICIGGGAFLATIQHNNTEVIFLASQDTIDLDAEVGYAPLSDYFSRLVPHVMTLRHILGLECWRPCESHAALIIDDPLLRRNYGFLNFDTLLHMTKESRFHTTIAFIPHNYKRNSPRILRMFRENPDRLALCFHGNDHTKSELASVDSSLLHTLLDTAEKRMKLHEQTTGLRCDQVMVFPQGDFSEEAMAVLKSRGYLAAVNTIHHPMSKQVSLTVAELAQPAVLRYAGFPLFLRTYVKETQCQDVAFNLFFGRPVFIVEHHDIFEHPEYLTELILRINAIAPQIRWSSLETAVMNSALIRTSPDGVSHIRAYAPALCVTNHGNSIERFSVTWEHSGPSVLQVLEDGICRHPHEFDGSGTRYSLQLPPGVSRTISLLYPNDFGPIGSLDLTLKAKALLRRRLSEFRDNYISKNQNLLGLAKSVQRRLLG